MKFLAIIFPIIMVLGVFSLMFIWLYLLALHFIPYEEGKSLSKFCEENGYESSEYGDFRWEKSYCMKQKDGTLIKREVDVCNIRGVSGALHDWCFVEEYSTKYQEENINENGILAI
jgi:hypothetical protein